MVPSKEIVLKLKLTIEVLKMVPIMNEKMKTHPILLDTLYLTDLVNIPWKEVRQLTPKEEKIEKIKEVSLLDLPVDLSEQQVVDILDRGYTIFITDNGGRRNFWVDCVNDKNESIVKETESIKGTALHLLKALNLANKLFQTTLKKNKPYHREGWFGKGQPYYEYGQETGLDAPTRLDQLLLDTNTMVILKKQHSLYELTFKREEAFLEEHYFQVEKVIIQAQKIGKSQPE